MSEPFYVARARVRKVRGVHRRAELETGTTVGRTDEVRSDDAGAAGAGGRA